MHHWLKTLIVTFLIAVPLVGETFGQLTAQQVRDSIDDAILYLRGEQQADGHWESGSGYDGGVTALTTLALLNAGVSAEDPQIQSALGYLRGLDARTENTYTISLMTMVFCMATPVADRGFIERNVEQLEDLQVRDGPNEGGWGYGLKRGGYADNSNSQFAVLALHEASGVGVEVKRADVWSTAKRYWQRGQLGTGAWSYFVRGAQENNQGERVQLQSGRGSMTCAGIAGMIICDEHFQEDDPADAGAIQCCGNSSEQDAIESGMRWLAEKFSVDSNAATGTSGGLFYYLYALERAGRLSGRRFIGDHDWYREGAAFLISRQERLIGAWRGANSFDENEPVVATSFALLFLAKGKRPILVSKYRHANSNDWDLHPKGIHFLTRELETLWDVKMNWQTIDGRVATANDLMSSPVLFISGKDELRLLERQKTALREYIDNGGFIFAEACNGNGCDATQFDRQFRQLMRDLFPDLGREPLQPLPADHPVWFSERILPGDQGLLLGVQACCRTSVIYCPQNLSCFWKFKQPARFEEFDDFPETQRQIQFAVDIGINVLTYATNRELKDKLDRPNIVRGEDDDLRSRDVLMIPKLAHGGGSDDAPGAWSNILKVFEQQMELRVDTENHLVAPDALEILSRYPIVFMHGRRGFSFTDEQRQNLREYLDRGGFLFVDSICASDAFADAFRREMALLYPESEMTSIPADHPLFSGTYRGFDLSAVNLNTPTRTGEGRLAVRTTRTAPLLEGIESGGRLVVIFSKYDLSCAMENAVSTECQGYDRDDAARIGVNVLLYALLN